MNPLGAITKLFLEEFKSVILHIKCFANIKHFLFYKIIILLYFLVLSYMLLSDHENPLPLLLQKLGFGSFCVGF